MLSRQLQDAAYFEQHRGMDVIVAGRHARVVPVQGQQVLAQVIRADRYEVDLVGPEWNLRNRRGYLYHHTQCRASYRIPFS